MNNYVSCTFKLFDVKRQQWDNQLQKQFVKKLKCWFKLCQNANIKESFDEDSNV